jgi:hypothetical protein
VIKLTTKTCNKIKKTDAELPLKKSIIGLMKSVANIQFHLMNLDYDSPKDAEKVLESRDSLFDTLFSILKDAYEPKDAVMEENEEAKVEVTVVNQTEDDYKDIRSVNK